MMTEQEMSALYTEYYPKVFSYVKAKLCNVADAEDITAEVFARFCAELPTFDHRKGALSTWLYTIARNAVTDHLRTGHLTAELSPELADPIDFTEGMIRRENAARIAEALALLPELQRDVVVFRYFRDMQLTEIAERMGISYSYAKKLHLRALAELKKFLEKNFENP